MRRSRRRPRDQRRAITWRCWAAPGRARPRSCTSSAVSWSRAREACSWKGEPLSTLDAAARGRRPGAGHRLRLPGLEPASESDGVGERRLRGPGRRRERAEAGAASGRRGCSRWSASAQGRLPAGGALGRRGTAGRHRPGARAAPELLLCDEPTGHLDSDTGERVLDLIEALRDELGFALVIATHDADVAARADRDDRAGGRRSARRPA